MRGYGEIIILVFSYYLVTKKKQKKSLFDMTEVIFLYLHKWMMQVVIYMDIYKNNNPKENN